MISQKLKVKDIIGDREISLYVGYNRYGGGYVAMPVYGFATDCVDNAFAYGNDYHILNTKMLDGLGLPYRTGESIPKLVDEILEVELDYTIDHFCLRFDRFADNSGIATILREKIESGSIMKNWLDDVNEKFPLPQ